MLVGRDNLGQRVKCPPTPWIDVDDAEATALIKRGLAVAVDVPDPVGAATPAEPEPPVEPAFPSIDLQSAALEPVAEPAVVEPIVEPEPVAEEPVVEPVIEPPPAVELTARQTAIAEVFDILEAPDLVGSGPRAGKPKVSAIEAATSLTDVTAAEVDVLFDARGA